MKIKQFNTFIKEAIRKDDLGHLNDDLPANSQNDKGGYDYEDDSTKDHGYYDDWYDESDFEKLGKSSNPKFDSDDDYDAYSNDDEDEQDDVENLHSLLRQMFRNAGLKDVRVTSKKNKEIIIECHLPKTTTLKAVISALDVANKLKKDVLSEYECDFDVWQKSASTGVLVFEFYLDDETNSYTLPF